MVKVPQGVTVVVGLGISGQAICRHLDRHGVPFMVADTREMPPGLAAFQQRYPAIDCHCGPLNELDFSDAYEVVVSPGVDPHLAGLDGLLERVNPATGEPMLVGETALFRRLVRAPVAAITGSNAKSTVTTLLGAMAKASGVNAAVGGNLGTAALDLLADHPDAELFILELSSFQLETTPRLGAASAAFLNLCDDHLDRHGDLAGYRQAKQRIFMGAEHAVVNADDPMTWPLDALDRVERFGVGVPAGSDWGLADIDGRRYLMHGETPWLAVDELAITGQHNQLNALAALAMGQALGFDRQAMCEVLTTFKGLPHRSETVAEVNGVRWVNDSKGTNVGATLAAINGIGVALTGKIILLAGGVGKGADFTPLAAPLAGHGKAALLYGADAERLDSVLGACLHTQRFETLTQAMEAAWQLAEPGDCVLLSPACASLDQFANYQARGDLFRDWIEQKQRESAP